MIGSRILLWHSKRIQEEYGKGVKEVMLDLYTTGVSLSDIAHIIGIGHRTVCSLVDLWGWERKPPSRPKPKFDAIRDGVISDRMNGATWDELKEKYSISTSYLWRILKSSPGVVGNLYAPNFYSERKYSEKELQRRSEACRELNKRMKEKRVGWYA